MTVNEEWRPISALGGIYSDYYDVSNLGRVRSKDRIVVNSLGVKRLYKGQIVSPYKSGNGHLQVKLYNEEGSSQLYVHRLVALEFVENPYGLPFINHEDGNKENNVFNNLKWCTQKQNVHHALNSGLHNPYGKNSGRAKSVINCRGEVFDTIVEASRAVGLKSPSSINLACKNERNYAGTYKDTGEPIKWKYYKEVNNE